MIKVVQDYGENIENERKGISFVCTIQCSRSLEGKRGVRIATGRQGVHCNVRHKAQPLEMSLTRSPASATVVAISPSTKAAFSAFCSLFQGS